MSEITKTDPQGTRQPYEPPLLTKHAPLLDITAVCGSACTLKMTEVSDPGGLRQNLKTLEKWFF